MGALSASLREGRLFMRFYKKRLPSVAAASRIRRRLHTVWKRGVSRRKKSPADMPGIFPCILRFYKFQRGFYSAKPFS